MLDIDKEELKSRFVREDWEYVFDKVYKIAEFILIKNYNVYNPELLADMKQECAENFYKKIDQGKVDGTKNIFSFIWKNSTFRILEILRKEGNRKKIAYFMPFDMVDFEVYRNENVSNRYAEAHE
jgi:hypothetical protein